MFAIALLRQEAADKNLDGRSQAKSNSEIEFEDRDVFYSIAFLVCSFCAVRIPTEGTNSNIFVLNSFAEVKSSRLNRC